MEVYWRHWKDNQKLRTLLVYDAELLIGIVPLVVKPMKTRLGTARALMYPLDDWGTFYGPIGADAAVCLEMSTDHILNSPRDWDMFDLRFVDTNGDDAGTTPTVLANHGLKIETFDYAETALIDLTGSWDEYLASRSGKARQTYLRAERRISADFEIDFVDYRPESQPDGGGDPRLDLLGAGGALYFTWVIPGMIFVAAVAIGFLSFLIQLPARTRNLFLAAGTVFVGGAIGVEMLSAIEADAHTQYSLSYALIITLEETMEMLGIVLFIYALSDYISRHIGELRVQFASKLDSNRIDDIGMTPKDVELFRTSSDLPVLQD